MEAAVRNGCFTANLSTEDFTRLGSFIQSNFGIKMSGNKKVMVESRLRKRLRQLDILPLDIIAGTIFKTAHQRLSQPVNVIKGGCQYEGADYH